MSDKISGICISHPSRDGLLQRSIYNFLDQTYDNSELVVLVSDKNYHALLLGWLRDKRHDEEVKKQLKNDVEVMVDTGIMHGADIVASIAHGARFTLIGRAYLYGLMAGGREGVDRALEILRGQMLRTMKLLGVSSLEELTPEHVKILQRLR